MRVLVACEFSGVVRDAFIAVGHDAMSCDLLPSDSPGPHHQGDVMDVLDDKWDLLIAHPPCTHLAVSGARHFQIIQPWQFGHGATEFTDGVYRAYEVGGIPNPEELRTWTPIGEPFEVEVPDE